MAFLVRQRKEGETSRQPERVSLSSAIRRHLRRRFSAESFVIVGIRGHRRG
jgi:hypothetical protein